MVITSCLIKKEKSNLFSTIMAIQYYENLSYWARILELRETNLVKFKVQTNIKLSLFLGAGDIRDGPIIGGWLPGNISYL